MKKRKWISVLLCVLIFFVIGIYLHKYYRSNEQIKIVYCQITERKDTEIVLKQTAGIDPNEYETINIYFLVERSLLDKFEGMADSHNVDTENNFMLTFKYNKLTDFKRKEDGVYFEIEDIVDVQEGDIIL